MNPWGHYAQKASIENKGDITQQNLPKPVLRRYKICNNPNKSSRDSDHRNAEAHCEESLVFYQRGNSYMQVSRRCLDIHYKKEAVSGNGYSRRKWGGQRLVTLFYKTFYISHSRSYIKIPLYLESIHTYRYNQMQIWENLVNALYLWRNIRFRIYFYIICS